MKMSVRGIYKIENMVNGKVYIGSATDVKRRFREHKCKLRQGIHSNKYLQSSWNKYGEKTFSFEHIVTVLDDDLVSVEQIIINDYNSANRLVGYNLIDMAIRLSGAKGMRHTEASKRLISEASKRNAHKFVRGDRSPKAKLKESDINVIRSMAKKGFSHSIIAERFGVTKQCIFAVLKGESWAHVPYHYVDICVSEGENLRKVSNVGYLDNPIAVIKASDVGFINEMLASRIPVSRIAVIVGVSKCAMLDYVRRIGMGKLIRRNGKLTYGKAIEIRELAKDGVDHLEIATAYGVSPSTIRDVVVNRTWVETIADSWVDDV